MQKKHTLPYLTICTYITLSIAYSASAQTSDSDLGVYVKGNSLSIKNGAVFAVFGTLMLDSATISGGGTLFFAGPSTQCILASHSKLSNLIIKEKFVVNIQGGLQVDSTCKSKLLIHTLHKDNSVADSISVDIHDTTQKNQTKPKVYPDTNPWQANGPSTAYKLYAHLSTQSIQDALCLETVSNNFKKIDNRLLYLNILPGFIPPEKVL